MKLSSFGASFPEILRAEQFLTVPHAEPAMYNSGDLALVEEFFFILNATNGIESEPIHLTAHVDLAEFRFTESELFKLRRLAQRLEFALSDEFSRQWAAASVVVEIRPRGN